ncbi:FBD-associated F-box protein At1g66310-like [Primulina eburnea]|uniref:FBD-associated F-box protein At1g66310-like n=1 Tax=Primulina eburnea TaxID=1245227 RepID=UPI003C6C4FA0
MKANTSILPPTIEDLPEDILVHILSFLPTLDANCTSILARSWRNLWHQVPGLRFDILPFYKKSSQIYSPARASFADSVWRAFFLLPPHRPLKYFQLAFHHADFGNREMEIRSWIRSALRRGVLKLELRFYSQPWMEVRPRTWRTYFEDWRYIENMSETFEFLFLNIMNSSVTEVQLHNCAFSFPSNVSAGFESLKILVLRDVLLTHKHQIECLVLLCVNLEILQLESIQNTGVDEFRIHLKRLKKLTLKGHFRLDDFDDSALLLMDIDTPELLSLTVVDFGVGFSSIRLNVPSLVEADFDFFSRRYSSNFDLWHSFLIYFQGVERLRIHNMWRFPVNYSLSIDLQPKMLPTFSYLKKLELITGFAENDRLGIFDFLEASPMLEMIIMDYDLTVGWFDYDGFHDNDVQMDNNFIDLKIPRLKEIKLTNYRNSRNERYLVEMFKANKVILEKIVAVPPKCFGKSPSSPIVLWESKPLALVRLSLCGPITSFFQFHMNNRGNHHAYVLFLAGNEKIHRTIY